MKRLSMPGFLAVCFIVILINMNINSYLQIRALDNIANLISESKQTVTYEQVNQADEMSYMTYDDLMRFDAVIYDLYLEEYCTNYCEECDSYYYKECMCNACSADCEECLNYDYELHFIMDHYDMIMDAYEEILSGIIERRNNPQVEVVPSYF